MQDGAGRETVAPSRLQRCASVTTIIVNCTRLVLILLGYGR